MVPAPTQDADADPNPNHQVAVQDDPVQCPNCVHNVPIDPSPKLLQYFAKRVELVKRHGDTSSEVFKFDFTICLQIKQDREREKYLARARARGWPVQLNFRALPDRIRLMEEELRRLIYDEDALEESYVWQTLKGNIGKLEDFAKSRRLQDNLAEEVRPG